MSCTTNGCKTTPIGSTPAGECSPCAEITSLQVTETLQSAMERLCAVETKINNWHKLNARNIARLTRVEQNLTIVGKATATNSSSSSSATEVIEDDPEIQVLFDVTTPSTSAAGALGAVQLPKTVYGLLDVPTRATHALVAVELVVSLTGSPTSATLNINGYYGPNQDNDVPICSVFLQGQQGDVAANSISTLTSGVVPVPIINGTIALSLTGTVGGAGTYDFQTSARVVGYIQH
jgi:hypothetical protein